MCVCVCVCECECECECAIVSERGGEVIKKFIVVATLMIHILLLNCKNIFFYIDLYFITFANIICLPVCVYVCLSVCVFIYFCLSVCIS